MEKVIKWMKPLLKTILLTGIIIGLIYTVIGFIVYIINVVCLNPTTVFQKTAFYIVLASIMGITWFCLEGKD